MIEDIFQKQKAFFNTGKTKDIQFRKMQLLKLYDTVKKYDDVLLVALKKDLNKSEYEAYMTEIGYTLLEISTMIKGLNKWSKPKKVRTPISMFPAKSYIYKEPYGVTLIISPWNYPFQLAIVPLAGAMAAGNCAIIKPSEYSSNISKVINKMLSECFNDEYIKVIEGDKEISQKLLEQKFDYIFFTGSENVGKIIMQAAAKNLTPVTLELGGKSPCFVDKNVNINLAAKRIVWGKFINAGQTCVAPDYILVDEESKEELIKHLIKHIKEMFSIGDTYPKIINENRFHHLMNLLKNEEIIYGGKGYLETLHIEPTLLDKVSWDSPIMQEEIFGPIIPIITYSSLEEVVSKVNNMPKPLSLYLFTNSPQTKKYILNQLSFGGGCINDTIVHLATPYLPFGGVGSSGMGSYHGQASFDTFSHQKSIMKRGKIDVPLRYPPFKKSTKLLRKFLK